jgi:hypothetical protein
MKRNAGSGARIGWESRGPRPKFFAAPEKNNSPLFLFPTVSLSSLSFFPLLCVSSLRIILLYFFYVGAEHALGCCLFLFFCCEGDGSDHRRRSTAPWKWRAIELGKNDRVQVKMRRKERFQRERESWQEIARAWLGGRYADARARRTMGGARRARGAGRVGGAVRARSGTHPRQRMWAHTYASSPSTRRESRRGSRQGLLA